MVWEYDAATMKTSATIASPTGNDSAAAAEPPAIKTRRISSVAYATEDSPSEENTASAAGMPRRSWGAAAVGRGFPTKRRFRRVDMAGGALPPPPNHHTAQFVPLRRAPSRGRCALPTSLRG
jgi:hypothetical protein